jgi:hypothetical protein
MGLMGDVIQFPVKKRPPQEDVIGPLTEEEVLERLVYERARQERLERIRRSLDQVNELMKQLNKIKGRDYDIFED